MLMIGAQLGTHRSVKDMSTQEIIEQLVEHFPSISDRVC
jgi:hypothetical protein